MIFLYLRGKVITFLIWSIFAFLFMLKKLSTDKTFSTTKWTIMIFLEFGFWFALLGFITMVLEFCLSQELFLAIKALENLFHMDKHVFLQRLSVDKHLATVVTEHAGIQKIVMLHLQMLLDL